MPPVDDSLQPGTETEPFAVVCLSSQEWDTPLPTNRQQIMRRLGERGHVVLFVETGGFLGKHLARIVAGPDRGSVMRRLVTGERVGTSVTVRKAVNVLPWGQRFAVCDRINGAVNAGVLRRATSSLPRTRVVWLYDPRATWATRAAPDALAVYDCVDDYAEQVSGGRNRGLMARADRRAATAARLVFTTTRALRDRHLATNPNTHLVGNVGEFSHFAPAADRSLARSDLQQLPRPVLGFVGNIVPGKVDLDLMGQVADLDPTRALVVAGPVDPAFGRAFDELAARPNVHALGPIPYATLPSVVASFDVGLIPYASNAYTRNVFPLKLFEYLAAGKPVVATGLPELEGLEPDVVVVNDARAVDAAVRGVLATLVSEADVRRRQAIAAENTWETRTDRLVELVSAELAAR